MKSISISGDKTIYIWYLCISCSSLRWWEGCLSEERKACVLLCETWYQLTHGKPQHGLSLDASWKNLSYIQRRKLSSLWSSGWSLLPCHFRAGRKISSWETEMKRGNVTKAGWWHIFSMVTSGINIVIWRQWRNLSPQVCVKSFLGNYENSERRNEEENEKYRRKYAISKCSIWNEIEEKLKQLKKKEEIRGKHCYSVGRENRRRI